MKLTKTTGRPVGKAKGPQAVMLGMDADERAFVLDLMAATRCGVMLRDAEVMRMMGLEVERVADEREVEL